MSGAASRTARPVVTASTPQASLLIIDDEPANVLVLERLLTRAGYTDVRSATDPREGLEQYWARKPDLLLLDIQMPHIDGFGVLEALRDGGDPEDFRPVIVLTADQTTPTRDRALVLGARDYLLKPFDAVEVLLRIENMVRERSLHVRLVEHNAFLEQRVRERTWQLELANREILERLALAAELRDDDTGEHVARVGHVSSLIARHLGCDEGYVELLRRAAPMHDVGKIGIPDHILLKPGKLDADEWEIMRSHTVIGGAILAGSEQPLLQLAEEVALYHHEKWDGSGYGSIAGDAIPLAGRIVAVADVFDALTHERPYKKAWPLDDALAEIRRSSGGHFDPAVVDAFFAVLAPALAGPVSGGALGMATRPDQAELPALPA